MEDAEADAMEAADASGPTTLPSGQFRVEGILDRYQASDGTFYFVKWVGYEVGVDGDFAQRVLAQVFGWVVTRYVDDLINFADPANSQRSASLVHSVEICGNQQLDCCCCRYSVSPTLG